MESNNIEKQPTKKVITLPLKEHFEVMEEGTSYKLPCYEVIDGEGIQETGNYLEINFVRGSRLQDEPVEKREGTLHEHLLAMMIFDLKHKNSLVGSRETSLVITKLEEGLHWLRQRGIDRIQRDVLGTYQK